MPDMPIEIQLQGLPESFPVVVLMQQQPSRVTTWSEYQWEAVGVMAHHNNATTQGFQQLVHEEGETRQFLYAGFGIRLHVDETESYYYNLISPAPCCYVITRRNENNIPVPFLVSLSFDEANAYLESDEEVYVVAMPPELYRWTEAFILMHYAPEKRVKRKRADWKKTTN